MTRSLLSRLAGLTLSILITLISTGCHSVDDERIPYCEVRLTFTTIGDWHKYGVGGAGESKRFILANNLRQPIDFPFSVMDRTGYGGLLLSMDALGNVIVYDLACPYEVRPSIRIRVPEGETYAECPECGSTYDIYTNYGHPLSGPSAQHGYALQRYNAIFGGALEYLVITR